MVRPEDCSVYVSVAPGGVGQGGTDPMVPTQCMGSTGSSGGLVGAVPDDVAVPTWPLPLVDGEGEPALPAEAHPAQTSRTTAVAAPNVQLCMTL